MKDEKKVKLTEEETKKEVQTEEKGVQLTDEELAQVVAGNEQLAPESELRTDPELPSTDMPRSYVK